MDESHFERAQEYAHREREAGIAAAQAAQKEKPLMIEGFECCRDCAEVIPRARLATGACRCIECQETHERREAGYRRRA
jgi:RNA polymerase-binding transcription factor DksA